MTFSMFTRMSLLQKMRARLESRSSTIVDLKYVLTSLSSLKDRSEVHDETATLAAKISQNGAGHHSSTFRFHFVTI